MGKSRNDILVAGAIFGEFERKRERKVLGMVDGVEVIGTKIFQILGEDRFLYGMHVYSNRNVPMLMARVDLDEIKLTPECTVVQWNFGTQGLSLVDEEEDTIPGYSTKCATLITNAEDCPDVEWN